MKPDNYIAKAEKLEAVVGYAELVQAEANIRSKWVQEYEKLTDEERLKAIEEAENKSQELLAALFKLPNGPSVGPIAKKAYGEDGDDEGFAFRNLYTEYGSVFVFKSWWNSDNDYNLYFSSKNPGGLVQKALNSDEPAVLLENDQRSNPYSADFGISILSNEREDRTILEHFIEAQDGLETIECIAESFGIEITKE